MIFRKILWVVFGLANMFLWSYDVRAENSLVSYEGFTTNEGVFKTQNRKWSKLVDVKLSTGKKHRDFWSNYDGKVVLTVEKSRNDGTTYNTNVTVWFDEPEEANGFFRMMNANSDLELYYDFLHSPLNSLSKWQECGIIPFNCRKHEATIVNSHEISADKLYIHNQATGSMTKVNEELESRELAIAPTNVHDGARDPSQYVSPGENDEQETQNQQSISV